MSKTLAALLIFLFSSFYASTAAADQYNDYFQITCKPESDYFSLRTLTLWVTDCESTKTCKLNDSTSQDSHLYVPESMLKKPYVCKLQDRTISVQLTDYIAPHYPGMCGLVAKYKVRIKLGDGAGYDFVPFGEGCPRDEKRHLIEINPAKLAYYFMIDCTLPDTMTPAPEPGSARAEASCVFLGNKELSQPTPEKK